MPIYVGSKKVKHIIHIKQYEHSVDSNARCVIIKQEWLVIL